MCEEEKSNKGVSKDIVMTIRRIVHSSEALKSYRTLATKESVTSPEQRRNQSNTILIWHLVNVNVDDSGA